MPFRTPRRPAVRNAVANHQTGCLSCHPGQHNGSVDPHGDDYSCGPCHGNGCYCHGAWTPVPTPHTTSDALPYYVNDAVVHLSATRRGLRLVRHQARRTIGSIRERRRPGTVITIPAPASGSQDHTLTFWSIDWSGNTEAAHTATFTVAHDSFPPTTTTNAVGRAALHGRHDVHADARRRAFDRRGHVVADGQHDRHLDGRDVAPLSRVRASGTAAHTLYFYSADSRNNTETVRRSAST